MVPTVVAVQVLRISFDAPYRYCRRPATTKIRPLDTIGSSVLPDLYVCEAHADQLVPRAKAKGIEVLPWPP